MSIRSPQARPPETPDRTRGFLLVLVLIACASPGLAIEAPWVGGGPEGGWVTSLFQSASGDLYAGTYGGGIFRSQDGGTTWSDASTNARDVVVWKMAQSDDSPAFLYATSADRGLLRARPHESFWSLMQGQPTGEPLEGYSVATFPNDPARLAFGTQNGVFVSRDHGNAWGDSLAYLPRNLIVDLTVLPQMPHTIHSLSPTELVVTSSTGSQISAISNGLHPSRYLMDMEPMPGSADSLLFADFIGLLYQLRDRSTFVDVSPIPSPDHYYQVKVDSLDGAWLAGSNDGLRHRDPVTKTWTHHDGGWLPLEPEVWTILPRANGDQLGLGSFRFGFALANADGSGPWTLSNSGLQATWVEGLHAWDDEVLAGTAHGVLYHSVDRGLTWTDVTGPLAVIRQATVHRTAGLDRWFVSGFEGAYYSDDHGTSWQRVGFPSGARRINEVRSFPTLGPHALVAASDFGLYTSTDGGANWLKRAEPDVPFDQGSFALNVDAEGHVAVGFDPRPGGSTPVIHAGHLDGVLEEIPLPVGFQGRPRGIAFLDPNTIIVAATPIGGSALYRIDNWFDPASRAFVDLELRLGLSLPTPRALEFESGILLLGLAEQGIMRSDDRGETWRPWSDGLITERIETITMLPGPKPRAYVGTLARGVYSREIDTGVPTLLSQIEFEVVGRDLRLSFFVHEESELRVRRIAPATALLFEGQAHGALEIYDALEGIADPRDRQGRWTIEQITFGGTVVIAEIQRDLRKILPALKTQLLQVHPNPFNPRTTIRWQQQDAARVRLAVFDIRGRLVRRLVDRDLGPGEHQIEFDGYDQRGNAVASGTYLLRLSVGERDSTGRMSLIR